MNADALQLILGAALGVCLALIPVIAHNFDLYGRFYK